MQERMCFVLVWLVNLSALLKWVFILEKGHLCFFFASSAFYELLPQYLFEQIFYIIFQMVSKPSLTHLTLLTISSTPPFPAICFTLSFFLIFSNQKPSREIVLYPWRNHPWHCFSHLLQLVPRRLKIGYSGFGHNRMLSLHAHIF